MRGWITAPVPFLVLPESIVRRYALPKHLPLSTRFNRQGAGTVAGIANKAIIMDVRHESFQRPWPRRRFAKFMRLSGPRRMNALMGSVPTIPKGSLEK